jgi:outer membrane lipoprotein-sorting protein
MSAGTKFVFGAAIAFALLPCSFAVSEPAAGTSAEKEAVLRRLDVSAATFRSTSAECQCDNYQTDPIPDKETQKGTFYFEHRGATVQMAGHIREINGKPAPKVYTYTGGVLKFFDARQNQVTVFNKAGEFQSYLMLGFGASGKDLEQKWEIAYLGSETLMEDKTAIKTEKLELVAKDAAVRKNLPKVTVWIDAERAVSLKQVFDQGHGVSRVCVYFNFKINQKLPDDAFTFKTDSETKVSNH